MRIVPGVPVMLTVQTPLPQKTIHLGMCVNARKNGMETASYVIGVSFYELSHPFIIPQFHPCPFAMPQLPISLANPYILNSIAGQEGMGQLHFQ